MSEVSTEPNFYAGEFSKQLDEKRRVTIPAKWRFKGDEAENSYLAIPTTYGSISVMPPQMIADLHSKISKISMANPAKRKALSKFLSKSCTFGCDKQGRIMLGETILSHVGIAKDVCLVGMGATFALNRTRWRCSKNSAYNNFFMKTPEPAARAIKRQGSPSRRQRQNSRVFKAPDGRKTENDQSEI